VEINRAVVNNSDAIALGLYEGTSQIQKLIIGRELTHVAAFA